ncbi:ArsR family transcriptional regulator [Candidatus Lokiarchaeum ossiferum]|uniref:ArsR family transcriptional regulator n=1 Tax=Candidatus Lokiarchaeum ossiferum TaxID=2951803 RepID=UPI00352F1DC2
MTTEKNASGKENKSTNLDPSTPFIPASELVIDNLETISLIKHDKKKLLLELLLHEEKTIMDMSKETGWNPGTVKRHLSDLVEGGLVTPSKIVVNEFRIKLKYYRATARQFRFQFIWPPQEK